MAPALLTGASGPDSDRKGGRVRAQFPQLQDAHSAVLRLGGGGGAAVCEQRLPRRSEVECSAQRCSQEEDGFERLL